MVSATMSAARAFSRNRKRMTVTRNHSFREIVQHRVQREMQQIAAVQHGHHFHARRQNAVIELVHLLVNRRERRFFLGTLAHAAPRLE